MDPKKTSSHLPDADARALSEHLLSVRNKARRSERRVVDAILDDPAAVQWMTLTELATKAGVSDPTVLRGVRAIGAKGFRDFKVWLTRQLATNPSPVHRRVTEPVAADVIVKRVFAAARDELNHVASLIDASMIERAAVQLACANRICLLATGASNVAALDVFQHLSRYGLSISHTPDAHIQTQTAATLGPDDVAVILSFTGRTKDNIRAAAVAKAAGACCVAITRQGSPLAEYADILVNVDPEEDTFVFSPMSARVAQLATCDVLCAAVGLAVGQSAIQNLAHAKASLRDLWIRPTDDETESE